MGDKLTHRLVNALGVAVCVAMALAATACAGGDDNETGGDEETWFFGGRSDLPAGVVAYRIPD